MEDGRDEMFCPSCGERMRRSANFCSSCGEPNRKQERVDWGPSPEPDPDAGDPGGPSRRTTRRGSSPAPGGGPGASPAPDAGPPPGRGSARSGRGPAPGAADTVDLPQWRAYLPAQRSASDESWLRPIGAAVGLAAASLLVPIIAIIFVAAPVLVAAEGFVSDLPDNAVLGGIVLLAIAQFAWFVGFGLLYLRRRGFDRERIVSYLGIERPTGKQLALVVGTAIGMVVAAGVVNGLLTQVVELLGYDIQAAENESTEILESNPSPLLLVGGIAFMLFVVGPAEELLFRGVIQGRLRERLSPAKAIAVASIVFGSVHVTSLAGGSGVSGLILTIAVLSTVAVALGTLYEYTGNLVVVALAHGLYNSILIAMLYLATVYDVDTEQAMLLPDILTALPV